MNLSRYPLYLVLLFQTGLAMLVPAIHGLIFESFAVARSFFYAALLLMLFSAFVGIAVKKQAKTALSQRDQLLILLAAFIGLPIFMAVPFQDSIQTFSFTDAYFEMVSSFTTTGMTLVDSASLTLHLWRAEVAWLGGYFTLVAAAAILAPLHLGGYEVISASDGSKGGGRLTQSDVREGANARIGRWSQKIFPVYLGLTGLLWFGLTMSGESVSVALIHALSVMSTSGISPIGGIENSVSGLWGELLIFAFLIAGLSRMTLLPDHPQGQGLLKDREIRLGLIIVILVPVLIITRHWIASIDSETNATLAAFWGGLFTTISFLTTTGFVSSEWGAATDWSGQGSMQIILVGLCIVGGGVATTTGGVKLMRVYALFGLGTKEMSRLLYPSAIGQTGTRGLRISRDGAQIAWVFFMLYALTLAAVMTALGLSGVEFEDATILAVSALSTTGPLATYAGQEAISIASLGDGAKWVLLITMVIGRVEALALISLLNPEFWRN